ncbi:NAD-dependent epimerase/dehydratase family protein [Yeosuana sp.]|uniref:NAD-dependent epimerase/dehydratase family protein n=1 Tax=Yeosuana sp. TaxID=2529388 RepID=UPI00404B6F33
MHNNQIVLGSGGAIGTYLAKELINYTKSIYLLSRNPRKVNETDTLIQADLLNTIAIEQALKNMDVAYLVVGLPYEDKVWERDWPIIFMNVVNACKESKVPLVFFDNIYAYDPEYLNNLTEDTPIKAFSRKGKLRAEIDAYLQNEIRQNDINIQIVRSADFYGVGTNQSILNEAVIANIIKGKKADWFLDASKKHSFTLVEDAAKATALLGNTQSAYNQVWHLPTDKAYTLNELIEIIKKFVDKPIKVRISSRFVFKLISYFIPVVRESKELLYQFENDYELNSSKFQKAFKIKPTPMEVGIKQLIENYKKK